MRIGKIIAVTLAVVMVAVATAAISLPEARWRLIVIGRYAAGQIEQMSPAELRHLLTPGSGFYPDILASSPNPFSAIVNPFTTPTDAAAGAALFERRCASCHGPGGVGGAGVRLLNAVPKRGSSDWALYRTISHGVAGTPMPPHPDVPWRESWQLVAYVGGLVRGTAGSGGAEAAPAPRVAEVEAGDIPALGGAADDWLTYSGSLDGIRFSKLDEITAANAGTLRLAWLARLDHRELRNEATPLAWRGVLFLSQPPGGVLALDAGTGATRWKWSRAVPEDVQLCCSTANRGVAILGDKVFVGTLDAHLVALDAGTGREIWNVEVADHRKGYSITGAPLAVRDMILTGVAGGEFGIRGFVDAYDARTGERRWRSYTVPAPGEPGADTWGDEAALAFGGAPTWMTGSYDPDLDVVYWGTGNPAPGYNADTRPGDNLYSDSMVALDAATGKRRWHFQFTPNDEHDWDATHVPLLVDSAAIPGHRKLLLNANRNGFFYVIDRENGGFVSGRPFARQTWTTGLDESGRPMESPGMRPSRTGTLIYPSGGGAANWWPSSFSPQTGLVYVPAVEGRASVFFKSDETLERVEGQLWLGSGMLPGTERHQSAVKALNPWTGDLVWQVLSEPRNTAAESGGLLSTAGGVVFGSDLDRFFALDARTGAPLWDVKLGDQIAAAPMTFRLDGRQYVVIVAGVNVLAFRLP